MNIAPIVDQSQSQPVRSLSNGADSLSMRARGGVRAGVSGRGGLGVPGAYPNPGRFKDSPGQIQIALSVPDTDKYREQYVVPISLSIKAPVFNYHT